MIGRMTADPELRRTGDGTPVCTFSLAVRRPRTKDVSDFVDFVAWRQSAEYLSQYGHKGDLVAVSGPLQSRKWTDKNGNNRINVLFYSTFRKFTGVGNVFCFSNSIVKLIFIDARFNKFGYRPCIVDT